MPIELHCQHCNQLVRAPDQAAGKRAKCPYCHQEVYVPTPPDQVEELELAPLDESWKDQKHRLDEEAERISEALRHEKGVPEEGGSGTAAAGAGPAAGGIPLAGEGPGAAGSAAPAPGPSRSGVERLVIEYLLAMKNSQLADAEALGRKLAGQAGEAKEFAQQLFLDPMPPPELADLAPGLLKGLLKKLLSQL